MNLDLRLFDVCVIWRLVVYGCQIVLGRHFKLFLFLIFWLKLHKFSLNFRRVHVGVEVSHDRKDDTHSHQERCEQHVFCPLQQHINPDELEAIRMPTVSDIWLGFRQKKKNRAVHVVYLIRKWACLGHDKHNDVPHCNSQQPTSLEDWLHIAWCLKGNSQIMREL